MAPAELSSDSLVGPVERFVAVVGAALGGLHALSGPTSESREVAIEDAASEADRIVRGFIDADALHTDEELRSYLVAFGPLLGGSLADSSVARLRASSLMRGSAAWLGHASDVYKLLVDADRTDGGRRSWAYYRVALDLAHVVASLDVHTARAELDAISSFRSLLLQTISDSGIPRPGVAFFGLPTSELLEAQGPPADAADPATRSARTASVRPSELIEPRPVEAVLAELDALVGLEPVKREVTLLTNLLTVQRLREERGLPTMTTSRHLIFTGNPGTGKTTVARLLAEIYHSLGVVEQGQLVETDRSALVAGYVGQTAERTRTVIESALGGLLLVDEAYALVRGGEKDFGREAIDTLVKFMEDHREDLVVIAAGYPVEMQAFVAANPGLRSRFPKTIHFPDYSDEELASIFRLIAGGAHYELGPGVEEAVAIRFSTVVRDRGFGNGRMARNLFESSVAAQASRLVKMDDPSNDELVTLTLDDVTSADLG